MQLKSLQDLFIHELQDLASAEQQIAEALPKMAKAAQNQELRTAFEDHLAETESQLEKVTAILRDLGAKPEGDKCVGIAGIIKEGEQCMKETEEPVRDAALIGAAQRVEHYEMAAYGTARAYAQQLGHNEAAQVLDQILDEEKATDEKLSKIARGINAEAEA